MIRAIVFDLGGVVFTSDGGSYETRDLLAKNLKIDGERLHNCWFKFKNKLITGKMSEDEYLKYVISELKLNLSLEKMKEEIRSYNEIDKSMVELIMKLKRKYSLFALTNDIHEWIEYRINKFNLRSYFDKIICSADIALAKPDVEIYKYLLKTLNLSPKEIIFVDNRIENVKSAELFGIISHHFTNKDTFEKWLKEEKII